MIERTIITGEENSKYFIHNNGLAKEWEKFCDDNNGSIEGQVNGAILEFEFSFQINKTNIQIHYLRQKSNNHTGTLIDHGYAMTKNTVISFSPIKLSNNDWKIYQCKGFHNVLSSIFTKTKELDYNKEYSYKSKTDRNKRIPISQRQFTFLSRIAELRHIENKEEQLIVEYFNAIGTNSLMKVINTIIYES